MTTPCGRGVILRAERSTEAHVRWPKTVRGHGGKRGNPLKGFFDESWQAGEVERAKA
jgi:hypothetical protein